MRKLLSESPALKVGLLMALLFSSLVWLWDQTVEDIQYKTASQVKEKPLLLTNPKLMEFSSNNLKIQLAAEKAEIYESVKKTELTAIEAKFYQVKLSENLPPVAITADFGQIDHQTNLVKIWGNVSMILIDGQTLLTQELFFQSDQKRVYNKTAVRVTSKRDLMTADSFTYDLETNVLRLHKPKVKLEI